MGKANRKYLIVGAILIIIALLLWAYIYSEDSRVTEKLKNKENEYLIDHLSNEKKEAYNEALEKYNDTMSNITSISVLIVVIGIVGFILILIGISRSEKKSKDEIKKEEKKEQEKKDTKKK